jgi:hypothetical protein
MSNHHGSHRLHTLCRQVLYPLHTLPHHEQKAVRPHLQEWFPIRVPSINRSLYKGDGRYLVGFAASVRPFLNTVFRGYERIAVPATIVFTAYYNLPQYSVDPDNLFVKPFIDSLAEFVLLNGHDGFREVVEVRKRTRIGRVGCSIAVYPTPSCRYCLLYQCPPTINGRCAECGEKK